MQLCGILTANIYHGCLLDGLMRPACFFKASLEHTFEEGPAVYKTLFLATRNLLHGSGPITRL